MRQEKVTDNALNHVAIIMDGNGRWAATRGLPRIEGHRRGVNATYQAVKFARERGIKHLSIFAFSSENWSRPKPEVAFLFKLFSKTLNKYIDELDQENIRIIFSGDRTPFSQSFKKLLTNGEEKTKNNKGMLLNIAFNYGGRWDIKESLKSIIRDVKSGKIQETDVSEELISQYLQYPLLPEPDLLIRTSGENRISNFFLWQAAYTELYFTDVLWPDFADADFELAIEAFKSRQRRFGKV